MSGRDSIKSQNGYGSFFTKKQIPCREKRTFLSVLTTTALPRKYLHSLNFCGGRQWMLAKLQDAFFNTK